MAASAGWQPYANTSALLQRGSLDSADSTSSVFWAPQTRQPCGLEGGEGCSRCFDAFE